MPSIVPRHTPAHSRIGESEILRLPHKSSTPPPFYAQVLLRMKREKARSRLSWMDELQLGCGISSICLLSAMLRYHQSLGQTETRWFLYMRRVFSRQTGVMHALSHQRTRMVQNYSRRFSRSSLRPPCASAPSVSLHRVTAVDTSYVSFDMSVSVVLAYTSCFKNQLAQRLQSAVSRYPRR